MSAQDIVDRLDHSRKAAEGRWIARCPAHDDGSPSLSVTETRHKQTGEVITLIHCHAGCGATEVLHAIGLDHSALFPPTDNNYHARRGSAPTETVDSLVIEIAEHDRRNGKRLSKRDVERYREAKKRKAKSSDATTEIAYEMGVVR